MYYSVLLATISYLDDLFRNMNPVALIIDRLNHDIVLLDRNFE